MALFEEMELWDNLIACYRLLQKKPQARRPRPSAHDSPSSSTPDRDPSYKPCSSHGLKP